MILFKEQLQKQSFGWKCVVQELLSFLTQIVLCHVALSFLNLYISTSLHRLWIGCLWSTPWTSPSGLRRTGNSVRSRTKGPHILATWLCVLPSPGPWMKVRPWTLLHCLFFGVYVCFSPVGFVLHHNTGSIINSVNFIHVFYSINGSFHQDFLKLNVKFFFQWSE